MRLFLTILASICFLSSKAQTHLPVSNYNSTPWQPLMGFGYNPFATGFYPDNKWHLTKYASLSAGTVFFNGATSYLSAPVGLQLSHSLNNNLYGFGSVSVLPTVYSFNGMFLGPSSGPSYPGANAYRFGMNSRVEMGLMYINDEKTFSISGSIGVERGSYPVYQVPRTNTKRQ